MRGPAARSFWMSTSALITAAGEILILRIQAPRYLVRVKKVHIRPKLSEGFSNVKCHYRKMT
jgi:hypothetical protein